MKRSPIDPEHTVTSWLGLEYKWLVTLATMSGTFVAGLSLTSVSVALPSIGREFDISMGTVTWVVIAFVIVQVGFMLPLSRLSDLTDRGLMFAIGMALFTLGSALCAIAQSLEYLVVMRVVQAVGAAMIVGNVCAIVADAFPASERGKAMGLMSMVAGASMAIGPTVGGLLIDLGGWRSVFLVNLPVGVAGAISIWLITRGRSSRELGQTFDLLGTILYAGSIALLLAALGQAGEAVGMALLLALGALVFFFLLVLVEKRVSQPLLPLDIFRNRLFVSTSACSFFGWTGIFAVLFLMPFYMERVLGYSPSMVGLLLAVVPVMFFVLSPFSGWLSDRIGHYLLRWVGLALQCCAALMLINLQPNPSALDLLLRFLLMGVGLGLFQPPNNSAMMGSVAPSRMGIASGILGTTRNMGSAVGSAMAAAIFAVVVADMLGSQTGPVTPQSSLITNEAFVSGTEGALVAIAAVFVLSLVFSLIPGQEQVEFNMPGKPQLDTQTGNAAAQFSREK